MTYQCAMSVTPCKTKATKITPTIF